MKISWFSELPLEGGVDRSFKNMRTEFAWISSQNSVHNNITKLPTLADDSYDIGIIIIPKTVAPYKNINIPEQLKRVCKTYAFMQEGTSWFFQDLHLEEQMWFYGIMLNADFVLAHNDCDKNYYEGLLEKPTFINPTLMIEDSIKDLPKDIDGRAGVIIGGNFVRWYGGFNSFIAASVTNEKIWAPMMGRMQKQEVYMSEINHIAYKNWFDWMNTLNSFKYAVHLNPNTIGGTFSLNSAYLKIPVIGNVRSNTQRDCFPYTSIEPDDLKRAKKLMKKLSTDRDFYQLCADTAKMNYESFYSESTYKMEWKRILSSVVTQPALS